MGGAFTTESVRELIFTDSDDSILVTFTDGRTAEIFGDGITQYRDATGISEGSVFTTVTLN